MLTFEEFFAKKKIDLAQLQQAEPSLFDEFKTDFAPMGEKSFDHSKKFWFNKLRRLYHLKEEPKVIKQEIPKTEIASQAEELSSPTIEQKPAFKPRFKPGLTSPSAPAPDQKNAITKPSDEGPEKPSLGYQPRFKMQAVTKKADPGKEALDKGELPDQKPPAYKPKFNLKTVTAKPEDKSDDQAALVEPQGEPPKTPAYKPKFNMKNIKPKSDD